MAEALRTLKIKTGAVRRLAKDVSYGLQESQNERQRMATLKQNGGDEYEVRAQDKVIADADQMVPDYRKRLTAALEELEELTASQNPVFSGTDELAAAKAMLVEAKQQL